MQYVNMYSSPLGNILLASDGEYLTGIWFEGQKYFGAGLDKNASEKELEIFEITKNWLNIYFSGAVPSFIPHVKFVGTDFQKDVWSIFLTVPYGKTVTYGDIAMQIAEKRNIAHMSAQAVGSAIGHNKISVIVPCHRVLGKDGSLTGYAGGTARKKMLLDIEKTV